MTDVGLPQAATSVTLPDAIEARVALHSTRRQRFVEHFVRLGNGAAAARAAGYSARRARQRAETLMKSPPVMAAISAARREIAEAAAFTVEKAHAQLSEDRKFAYETENATAAVRATELMAKMAGFMVDRIDARVAMGFSVNLHIPMAVLPHE